jgi:hypothetical protein
MFSVNIIKIPASELCTVVFVGNSLVPTKCTKKTQGPRRSFLHKSCGLCVNTVVSVGNFPGSHKVHKGDTGLQRKKAPWLSVSS